MKIFRKLKNEAKVPILIPSKGLNTDTCANITTAPRWHQPPLTMSGQGPESFPLPRQSFEDSLRQLDVVDCENALCKNLRFKLEKVAPPCKWVAFRTWALVVVSCSSHQPPREVLPQALWGAGYECSRLYGHFVGGGPRTWQEYQDSYDDWFGIWQVAYWVSSSRGLNNGAEILFSQVELDQPEVRNAINKLSEFKLCQRRLWNFVLTCERRLVESPEIVAFLQSRRSELERSHKHNDCTPEQCYFDDDNTTQVEQTHKCRDKSCGYEYIFEPSGNNITADTFQSTAWQIPQVSDHNEKCPIPNCERYMAISHVWSDGTGAGSKRPGMVNGCLVDFFRQFAVDSSNQPLGIWWDTISIPTDRGQRAHAIERMHQNYKNALFTLVHDEELINFDWKDDGSPCVALVLSTWFSRGWTALELQRSKSVKVLFRNPESYDSSTSVVMKDLDEDILAQGQVYHTHIAHRAATEVIQKVRQQGEFRALHNVVGTLRSRYTSWTRDRLIIAGQMLNLEGIQSNWPKDQITRSALTAHTEIWPQALLHGKTTMRKSGPWSWCPISFLDLEGSPVNEFLSIEQGQVVGPWMVTPAKQADILEVVYSHESVKWRIEFALQSKERCLLLVPTSTKIAKRRSLVVVDLGKKGKERYCQYVGTVIANVHGRQQCERIRLGSTMEEEDMERLLGRGQGLQRLKLLCA